MSGRGQAETRAATVLGLVLAGSVAVSAIFPIVEYVLNVTFTVVAVVAVLAILFIVARDLLP